MKKYNLLFDATILTNDLSKNNISKKLMTKNVILSMNRNSNKIKALKLIKKNRM